RGLFVDKLLALEGGKAAIQFLFGLGDHLTEQTHRELAPDHRKLLQQGLLFWSQAVDTGGEHALHRGGDIQLRRDFFYAVVPTCATQYAFFGQGLHHFFHKERRPLGLLQNERLETLQPYVVAQQTGEQFLGLGFAQGRKTELGVIGLTPPLVAVFGPIVHQQQDLCRGDTLTQHVEKALGLAVDPVQVLKDEDER